jgi:AmmeMemoRadiSam system protein B
MTASSTRKTQLDGRWYPATAEDIDRQFRNWAQALDALEPLGRPTPAVVVPHAGWAFSGLLAAKTLKLAVDSWGPEGPELFAVVGGHLPPGAPTIAFEEKAWATPLGPLETAPELNGLLPDGFRAWTGPTNDNTIEVILPLVKFLSPSARLWALRTAPDAGALALGRLLAEASAGRRTLVVASTDLTHYGRAYGFAPAGEGEAGETFRRENDLAFIEAALPPDPSAMIELGVRRQAACSAGAAAAAAQLAKLSGAEGQLVDHFSSYDVIPGPQSVGYAGIVYVPA